VASMDLVGPLTERICEVWHAHTQEVPEIVAGWEQPDSSFSFLLSPAGGTLPTENFDKRTGIRLAFRRSGGVIWAVASRPPVASLSRGIYAFADGLLVAVGARPEGWLLLPILGAPMTVSGPRAAKLVEALVVAGALRAREEE